MAAAKRKKLKGKPEVIAILLADRVYVDVGTNKFVIAGIFSTVTAYRFPTIHPHSALYVHLADFSGRHELSVRFVDLSNGTELARGAPMKVTHKDRLTHHEIRVMLPSLRFEHAGKHALELLWNGEYLGQCVIEAIEVKA